MEGVRATRTERNGVWVPEDGDSCHKTGKIDGNAELNPMYHLLTLLGAHPILHISRIKVKNVMPQTENAKCSVKNPCLTSKISF
jgi:hypothetical protein